MAYPFERSARDRFVLARRPRRLDANPWGAPAVVVEPELTATGDLLDVATLFLIGRECPWRRVLVAGHLAPGEVVRPRRFGLFRQFRRQIG